MASVDPISPRKQPLTMSSIKTEKQCSILVKTVPLSLSPHKQQQIAFSNFLPMNQVCPSYRRSIVQNWEDYPDISCDVNIKPAATIYSPSTYLGIFTQPSLTQAIEPFYIKLISIYKEKVRAALTGTSESSDQPTHNSTIVSCKSCNVSGTKYRMISQCNLIKQTVKVLKK